MLHFRNINDLRFQKQTSLCAGTLPNCLCLLSWLIVLIQFTKLKQRFLSRRSWFNYLIISADTAMWVTMELLPQVMNKIWTFYIEMILTTSKRLGVESLCILLEEPWAATSLHWSSSLVFEHQSHRPADPPSLPGTERRCSRASWKMQLTLLTDCLSYLLHGRDCGWVQMSGL